MAAVLKKKNARFEVAKIIEYMTGIPPFSGIAVRLFLSPLLLLLLRLFFSSYSSCPSFSSSSRSSSSTTISSRPPSDPRTGALQPTVVLLPSAVPSHPTPAVAPAFSPPRTPPSGRADPGSGQDEEAPPAARQTLTTAAYHSQLYHYKELSVSLSLEVLTLSLSLSLSVRVRLSLFGLLLFFGSLFVSLHTRFLCWVQIRIRSATILLPFGRLLVLRLKRLGAIQSHKVLSLGLEFQSFLSGFH